jgi:hypothetical protein
LSSEELLAFSPDTRTMIEVARIALTIDSAQSSPGPMLRGAIQQERPRFSKALQMALAASLSFEERPKKTCALTTVASLQCLPSTLPLVSPNAAVHALAR